MNFLIFGLIFALGVFGEGHHEDPLDSIRYFLEGSNYDNSVAKSVVLSATPKILEKSGDWVDVTISGVDNPSKNDLIALYSPANADISKASPVKFIFAKKFKGDYVNTGNATVRFSCINMHSDISFVLFSNEGDWKKWDEGQAKAKAIGKSNAVTFKNLQEPNQGHIALTKVPGEMRVMWATGYSSATQSLKIGSSTQNYSQIIPGVEASFTSSNLCNSPGKDWGWKNPGRLFNAVAKKLTPGIQYFYSFGSDATGWSTEASFSVPQPASSSGVTKFIAFGDMGKGHIDGSNQHHDNQEPSKKTVANILKRVNDIDLVFHVGDISYARGYSAQWDEFMNQIQPVASRVPWMTLPGNHEWIFPDAGGECGVPYQRHFVMPHTYGKPWYSFEHGPVHFVTFNTEESYATESAQHKWIESDLKSVDRKRTPWVVFSGHRPMWQEHKPDYSEKLQKYLEPLLNRYKVDVAFWGHVHNYQRTCPMYKGKCEAGKTTHVVIGMGGFNIDKSYKNTKSYIKSLHFKNGYSLITATKNQFKFEYFENEENSLIDHFTLSK